MRYIKGKEKVGKDIQGIEVSIGDYLIDPNNKFLNYQVRVRQDKIVLHAGACYFELKKEKLKQLMKVWATDGEAVLGMGANLFKNRIYDEDCA